MNRLRAYFCLGTLATVGAVVGIGSAIYGMSGGGGGGSGGSTPYQYIPTGLNSADNRWQQQQGQLGGYIDQTTGQIAPNLSAAYQAQQNIDPSQLQATANQAGGYYGQLASQQDQYHTMMGQQAGVNFGAQQAQMNAGNQLYQTSLDPQNALRAQMQQQTVDASRAGTSARGIGMSGNAAGIENQDVSNFLMNWQNQQLQRQATGLQGMTSAYAGANQQGQAGQQGLIGSSNMAANAAGSLQQSGAVPFNTAQQIGGLPYGYANQYGGAMNSNVYTPYGASSAQQIPYMNSGQNAGQNAFNQGQTNLNNLTTGLNQFGQATGGGFYGGQQQYPPSITTNYGNDNTSIGPPDPGGGYSGP